MADSKHAHDLKITDAHNATVAVKAVKRFASLMTKYGKFPDGLPRKLDVDNVLFNRGWE